MKKIIILIISVLPFIAFSAETKKVYIGKLMKLSGDTNYSFYETALSRSISGTLKQNNVDITFHQDIKKPSDLISDGYQFLIRGGYSVNNGEIAVTFSVIYLKKFLPIINATVNGYADPRVFELIDKICKSLSESISSYVPERENKVLEVKIDKQGKIEQRNEETTKESILKKLVGLWKLKDTSPFFKRYFLYPPGGLRINADGSWYWWCIARRAGSDYPAGRVGAKGNKTEIFIPAKNGGIASLHFTNRTHSLNPRTFNWISNGINYGYYSSIVFRNENTIEFALFRDDNFDYPPAGNEHVNMVWERVR